MASELETSQADLEQQLQRAFPAGLPERCTKLLDDVASMVLTPEEAMQLASMYEEEANLDAEAQEFIDDARRRISFATWSPFQPGIPHHILTPGYLSFQPSGLIRSPLDEVHIARHIVSVGYLPLVKRGVSIASHVMSATGYLSLAPRPAVEITSHVISKGYLSLVPRPGVEIASHVTTKGYLSLVPRPAVEIASHVTSKGYLSLVPQPAVPIAKHVMTAGYLSLKEKPLVSVAPHILKNGYLNLSSDNVRLAAHIWWVGYLPLHAF